MNTVRNARVAFALRTLRTFSLRTVNAYSVTMDVFVTVTGQLPVVEE